MSNFAETDPDREREEEEEEVQFPFKGGETAIFLKYVFAFSGRIRSLTLQKFFSFSQIVQFSELQ